MVSHNIPYLATVGLWVAFSWIGPSEAAGTMAYSSRKVALSSHIARYRPKMVAYQPQAARRYPLLTGTKPGSLPLARNERERLPTATRRLKHAVSSSVINPDTDSANALQGRAMLIGVASLYGALTVVLRLLTLMEGAPTASMLSAVRGGFAALCFLPAAWGFLSHGRRMRPDQWLGATEMAVYNLGAQGLLAAGIYHTDATRAAFFTQASVVLTPIISAVSGDRVPRSMWTGCLIAMVGITLLGLSDASVAAGAVAAAPGGFNVGDMLCLGGAVCWSMYICRMTAIMRRGLSPLLLQTWKTIILAGLYGTWALVGIKAHLGAGLGAAIATAWPGWRSLSQWGLIALSAIGPGALADWMQSVAQRSVSNSETNIILTSEPLWSALLAFGLLHERIAGKGLVGAGLIVVAAIVASGVFDRPRTAEL